MNMSDFDSLVDTYIYSVTHHTEHIWHLEQWRSRTLPISMVTRTIVVLCELL